MSPTKSRVSRADHTEVVAVLPKLPHPYSSITLSPDRQYAVTACKDLLQIVRMGTAGISVAKQVPIAHHFRSEVDTRTSKLMGKIYESKGGTQQSASSVVNVVLTDVAWNKPQPKAEDEVLSSSLVAAAGSNGVIVIWTAQNLLEGGSAVPEAALSQHIRAVNRLAWHPTRPNLLLSASQDGKVLLWERRKATDATTADNSSNTGTANGTQTRNVTSRFNRFFTSTRSTQPEPRQSFAWHCRAAFEPKSEAIRDIQWSPFLQDVFAMVTSSGLLILYDMYLPNRAMMKMTAHAGDATSLDWHPKLRSLIATGGSSDRCVKVWNLEQKLERDEEYYMALNQSTVTSRADSVATDSSTENDSSPGLSFSQHGALMNRTNTSFTTAAGSSRHRGTSQNMLHFLSISASVTRVRWRPLAGQSTDTEGTDRHESMIAVATAPIKGASAGGAGMLALWSWKRPFMPLSVVSGHSEGAITDFQWLDTPAKESDDPSLLANGDEARKVKGNRRAQETQHESAAHLGGTRSSSFLKQPDSDSPLAEGEDDDETHMGIWQHVLSVGRDGRCLIQSLARGDRPISRVSPSCFAMANLSPFQSGCGSLQIFSVCQPVPSSPRDEFLLTGLRRDLMTAKAPGIFREHPASSTNESSKIDKRFEDQLVGELLPTDEPELHFNVIDEGDLDADFNPITSTSAITVAPEVLHFSRFADRYEYYLSERFPSRVEICMHNAYVAESLKFEPLAQMWKFVAIILDNSGVDGLPDKESEVGNVSQFVSLPTIRAILEERADAGDLQTCVTLCEVLQIVTSDEFVKIPGLALETVREWYLAYIDILRDMCLFSQATVLVKNCLDPFISALNKQSTSIHEACPQCGKPLLPSDGVDSSGWSSTARRVCKSCRRRVGLCFLCHQPVEGVYVWCPGCGHGGHLSHALEWFGGQSGTPVREFCPTGCGHRCNGFQQLSAFPTTHSMKGLPVPTDSMDL